MLGSALRRAARRLRRRLGLPALGPRAVLWLTVAFLGLAFATATILVEFVGTLGQYRSQQYEPKDFQREEYLEQSAKPPRGTP